MGLDKNPIPCEKNKSIDNKVTNTYDLVLVIIHSVSREATISRLDLSYFSICILGYSQNRLISFDSRRIKEARPYSSNSLVKAKSYSAHQAFEILVYKLTDNFIHFVGCKPKFKTIVLHDESSPQSQRANGKLRQAGV